MISKDEERLTPPFSQMARGAVSGLLRAAKNQNLDGPAVSTKLWLRSF